MIAKESKQPILVTGAHRSGTTWVGKMLAADRGTAYISEPLNVLHRPGVFRIPVNYWYPYICIDNEPDYYNEFQETLAFRYHLKTEINAIHSRKDTLRMGRDLVSFFLGRIFKKRPLLKDPFAMFSAPWFSNRLDCKIVITVRHPAAFVSSLKRLNWPFLFSNLLGQPLLMNDLLKSFRDEMEQQDRKPEDILGGASLLWKIIYSTVKVYQEKYPDFIVIRHEDLSKNPLEGFHSLYTSLGLTFNQQVERKIFQSSGSENPRELAKKNTHSVRLNSQANLDNWKKRLDSNELDRIRTQTEEITEYFYPDFTWD